MPARPDHFRRLERMYLSAPINAFFRPAIEIAEGSAIVRMEAREDFHHAAHAMHGAAYFKCLDDAAFFAANSVVEDAFVLTVTFNVVLLRPVAAGLVTATGKLVSASKNLMVAESELADARGKLLARGSGTFMRSTTALDASLGYL